MGIHHVVVEKNKEMGDVMKSFKKAIKCIALVGAAAGTLTMVLKALSLHQRVNAHEEKAVLVASKLIMKWSLLRKTLLQLYSQV